MSAYARRITKASAREVAKRRRPKTLAARIEAFDATLELPDLIDSTRRFGLEDTKARRNGRDPFKSDLDREKMDAGSGPNIMAETFRMGETR